MSAMLYVLGVAWVFAVIIGSLLIVNGYLIFGALYTFSVCFVVGWTWHATTRGN